ncbi:MAG: WD40 repeat domain-containing protein [Chloroflexota bacterium]|nr:WD40 repeat domain-containing protein [Chloroflexota bacterium]
MQPLHDAIPEERDPHNEGLIDLLGREYGNPGDKPPLEEVQEQAMARVLTRLQASRQAEEIAPLQPDLLPTLLQNARQKTMNSTVGTFGTPAVPRRRPFPRMLHVTESALAVALVASLVIAWLVVTRLPHSQGTQPDQKSLFTYTGQRGETVFDMQWTPGDRYLTFILYKGITDAGPQQYRFMVWDRETGKLRQTHLAAQNDDEKHVLSVNVSLDGRYAFIKAMNGDKTTLKIENMISGQIDSVTTDNVLTWPEFSPDSTRLAYVGSDNRIHIWDLPARKSALISDPISGRYTLTELWWLANGKSLVLELSSTSRSWETFVLQIWNPVTGHKVQSIASTPSMRILPSNPYAVESGISPDGQRLLTYNNTAGTMQVRDTTTLHIISTFHTGPLVKEESSGSAITQSVRWVAAGQRIFSPAPDRKGWQIWDPETGRLVINMPTKQPDDGSQMVEIFKRFLLLGHKGKPIEVRDMITGKRVSTIQFSSRQPSYFTGPTNDLYTVIQAGNSLVLYDLHSGKRLAAYSGDNAWLSDDGRYIVIGNDTPVAKHSSVTIPTIKVIKVA